ncbi:hypothetical protein Naga_100338g4 [Nannochloropsis gaditana]|uniref:Uncharacterized protein n=1 Tax=Nannochloropsis gaditana TaxID=72520 RepID=W7U4Q1_9STRA|nr:hypothetical protein Naga_100338g4 [Nannochloropsis gaditana]
MWKATAWEDRCTRHRSSGGILEAGTPSFIQSLTCPTHSHRPGHGRITSGMPRHRTLGLMTALVWAYESAFMLLPSRGFRVPFYNLPRPLSAHKSPLATGSAGKNCGMHTILYARLRDRGDEEDEMESLLRALLRGDRGSMEDYEQRRRLEAVRQEEASQGLWGKAKSIVRRVASKAPLLLIAPVVLWAGFQLSGVAVSLGLTSALVFASFALPPMFALTFLMPLVVLMLVGTFVFPILPFAILGFLPGFVLLPLVFLGGVFMLTQFAGSSRSSSSTWGLTGFDEESWPWGGKTFTWVTLDADEGMEGRRKDQSNRGRNDGIIDVTATEADDDEEDGAYAGVGEVACLLGRFPVFLNRVTVGGTEVTDLT